MSTVKKITAFSIAAAIFTSSLTGCGNNNTEDTLNAPDTSESSEIAESIAENEVSKTAEEIALPPETPEEILLAPETYEDYMKLADTYLQKDGVIQALAVLDEGIEKMSTGEQGEADQTIDLLSQRKEYILAGTIAIRTKYTENEYDDEGNILSGRVLECDNNGNEIKDIDYGKGGEISRSAEYQYDADENLIEYKYSYADGSYFSHQTWAYDENGNKIECVEYDENGKEIKRTVYDQRESDTQPIIDDYDEQGNRISHIICDDDGNIIEKEEYEYDKNGNEIKHIFYGDGEIISYRQEYEYDENGHEIKYVSYDSEGNIDYIREYRYDENGRQIYIRYNSVGTDTRTWEYEYDERGNRIKTIYTNYDQKTGQKEQESRRWEREYDIDGMIDTASYFYDNEKTASYHSQTEYDENGLITNYTSYDKNGAILSKKETEYDASGNVIRENYYDTNGNLMQYYEKEYDDLGSVTRQAMYENGILKSEKQMSYVYRYIGNIDAEASDYRDDDITLEEYNLKQREIFLRFLQGQEKISYCNECNSIDTGRLSEETTTDLIDFAHYKEHNESLEYTFLDMTGDGIEELIINCNDINLYVIQNDFGILKLICSATGGNYGTYLVQYDGRLGICCDFGGHVGANEKYYYFLDGKGKKEITLGDYQCFLEDGTESRGYCISDSDSYESRDISTGEYYDITDKIVKGITIDWHPLEEPNK